MGTCLRSTEHHVLNGITQCCLPFDTGERTLSARQAGTQFTYPGGMKG